MVCVVFNHFYEPSSNPRYSITRKLNGLPSMIVVGYDPAAVAGRRIGRVGFLHHQMTRVARRHDLARAREDCRRDGLVVGARRGCHHRFP